MVNYFYESFSRPLPDRRSTRRLQAAANTRSDLRALRVRLTFSRACLSLVIRRLRGATSANGSSQRDGGHLSATRMSFIVQIFSLLYSYRYIVTLRNADCGGDRYASPRYYCTFLIFLLNKCEHAESIDIVCLYVILRPYNTFPYPNLMR